MSDIYKDIIKMVEYCRVIDQLPTYPQFKDGCNKCIYNGGLCNVIVGLPSRMDIDLLAKLYPPNEEKHAEDDIRALKHEDMIADRENTQSLERRVQELQEFKDKITSLVTEIDYGGFNTTINKIAKVVGNEVK